MIALLLINIAAITTIVIHIRNDHSVEDQNQFTFAKVLDTELGFSSTQRNVYDELKMTFNNESGAIIKKMQEKRAEMVTQLNDENADTLSLYQLANDIGDLHRQLKVVSINHLLEVKKMCTPGQKEKLTALFNNILKCEGSFKGQGQGYRWRHRRGQQGENTK